MARYFSMTAALNPGSPFALSYSGALKMKPETMILAAISRVKMTNSTSKAGSIGDSPHCVGRGWV